RELGDALRGAGSGTGRGLLRAVDGSCRPDFPARQGTDASRRLRPPGHPRRHTTVERDEGERPAPPSAPVGAPVANQAGSVPRAAPVVLFAGPAVGDGARVTRRSMPVHPALRLDGT